MHARCSPPDRAALPVVQQFRMRLWNHHLGLPARSLQTRDANGRGGYGEWQRVAAHNTRLFRRALPACADSHLRSFKAMAEAARADREEWDAASPAERQQLNAQRRALLQRVRGFAVFYPQDLLADESLAPNVLNVELTAAGLFT
jgi:hypothetical protein